MLVRKSYWKKDEKEQKEKSGERTENLCYKTYVIRNGGLVKSVFMKDAWKEKQNKSS